MFATDIVFVSKDGSEAAGEAGGVRFSGRVGVYSNQDGGKEERFLLGGSLLQKVGRPITQPVPEVRARIVQSYRRWHGDDHDGFLMEYDGVLPSGDDLRGAGVYVSNPGKVTNVTVEDFLERKERMHCPWMFFMAKDVEGPEKGLQEALETNNQGQIRRWAPQKEAADRARSLLAQVGGDWAFVVERIEPLGGIKAGSTKGGQA